MCTDVSLVKYSDSYSDFTLSMLGKFFSRRYFSSFSFFFFFFFFFLADSLLGFGISCKLSPMMKIIGDNLHTVPKSVFWEK